MIQSLLDSLMQHLESHFQEEEVDGLFDELMEQAPHVAPRIDALINEHYRLLIATDDLRHRFGRVRRTAVNWRRLSDSLERFRQMLRAHEREESNLMQEVYTRDMGSKD